MTIEPRDWVRVLGGQWRRVTSVLDIGKPEWWQCDVEGVHIKVWLDDITDHSKTVPISETWDDGTPIGEGPCS